MDRALELADYEGMRAKQAELRNGGASSGGATKQIGIGFSSFIEACGIAPSAVVGSLGAQAGLYESGEVRVHPTGSVTVYTGSSAHGQGHHTTFAQIVAEKLGLDVEAGRSHPR